MSARVIDGKAVAADIRARVAAAIAELPAPATLAVVLVGEDPASQVYVRNKVRETEAAGMLSREVRLPTDTSEGDVIAQIAALSADDAVDAILVQLPLPAHIDAHRALAAIDPQKDVDGLTDVSAGRLVLGQPGLRPCTPSGCVILAKTVAPKLAGLKCVIVGRSILVGKPAALLFLAEDCTVTMAHSRTADLAGLCREADILVPAVGRAEMVRGDWIKPGAVVIDVGINRVAAAPGKARLVGDVAFGEAVAVAGAITPVPGGVGPMTIACLLRNAALAAFARRNIAPPTPLRDV